MIGAYVPRHPDSNPGRLDAPIAAAVQDQVDGLGVSLGHADGLVKRGGRQPVVEQDFPCLTYDAQFGAAAAYVHSNSIVHSQP